MATKKKDIPAHIIPPAAAADPPAPPRKKKPTQAQETIKDLYDVIRQQAERLSRTERACDAEVAYWKKETERLHQELVSARINEARKR